MTDNPFRIPTDAEIADAESRLNFRFPDKYIRFLKGSSDVANAALPLRSVRTISAIPT